MTESNIKKVFSTLSGRILSDGMDPVTSDELRTEYGINDAWSRLLIGKLVAYKKVPTCRQPVWPSMEPDLYEQTEGVKVSDPWPKDGLDVSCVFVTEYGRQSIIDLEKLDPEQEANLYYSRPEIEALGYKIKLGNGAKPADPSRTDQRNGAEKAETVQEPEYALRKIDSKLWTLRFKGQDSTVHHSKGLADIARMLAYSRVHVAEMEGCSETTLPVLEEDLSSTSDYEDFGDERSNINSMQKTAQTFYDRIFYASTGEAAEKTKQDWLEFRTFLSSKGITARASREGKVCLRKTERLKAELNRECDTIYRRIRRARKYLEKTHPEFAAILKDHLHRYGAHFIYTDPILWDIQL